MVCEDYFYYDVYLHHHYYYFYMGFSLSDEGKLITNNATGLPNDHRGCTQLHAELSLFNSNKCN